MLSVGKIIKSDGLVVSLMLSVGKITSSTDPPVNCSSNCSSICGSITPSVSFSVNIS